MYGQSAEAVGALAKKG